MFQEVPTTQFAPPQRAEPSVLKKDAAFFRKNNPLNKIADAVSTMLLVLNRQRQIVYANNLFFQSFSESDIDTLIGKRPGEAVNCIHAIKTGEGCGTSEFCRNCGAEVAELLNFAEIVEQLKQSWNRNLAENRKKNAAL